MSETSFSGSRSGFRLAGNSFSESSLGGKAGQTLSISALRAEEALAAVITSMTPDQLSLVLPYALPDSGLEAGGTVHVRYWNQEKAYAFDSEILAADLSQRQLTISRPVRQTLVRCRQNMRYRAQVPLRLTILRAQEGQLIGRSIQNARTLDISEGGLKFKTELPLKGGDLVEAVLTLAPSRDLTVRMEVAWCGRMASDTGSAWSIGFKFLDLKEEGRNRLALFLAEAGSTEKV